ncbi:unnamed protein product [Effrenium voratum]|nr:unnamed protein product [Effrenium voratum]
MPSVREVCFASTCETFPASPSGAGEGRRAGSGAQSAREPRNWLPTVRPDGKMVCLSTSARTPRRWDERPQKQSSAKWGVRVAQPIKEEAELPPRERAPLVPTLPVRRRSVEEVVAGLRTDVLKHSSTNNQTFRYRAGQSGVWESIQENASSLCVRLRRRLDEEEARERNPDLSSPVLSNDPGRPLTYLTVVVLLLHVPCNPLNLEDILLLRRARQAVEAFHRVVVAGALVLPFSTRQLQRHYEGEKVAVQLPFAFRMDMAQSVIDTSEASWIMTDNCQEGCLANAPNSLLSYFSEYTRSRLYDRGHDTQVLEVHYEDNLWSSNPRHAPRTFRVPEKGPIQVLKTRSVKDMNSVLLECPKMMQCRELLRRAIWLLCRNEETTASFDILRRLLGQGGAELMQRWASKRTGESTIDPLSPGITGREPLAFRSAARARVQAAALEVHRLNEADEQRMGLISQASELQRRLRTRQLLIFDAWLRLSVLSRKRGAHAEALQDRSSRVRGTEVALAWLQHGRRRAAAAQLGAVLARANTRWIGEEEWMRRALVDKSLQSVFQRFAEALDQQGSGPQAQGSLMMRGTFQSVVAMVWARQQLSVVLGRLRGYFQPWLLGLWPKSAWPLLAPNDPYFLQAEIRLRVMMSKLDAVRAQEQGPAIYKLMQGDGSRSAQRLLTWQALADLLVVHHPGVRQNVEPVATKGVVALPQFGNIRLDPKQRAWPEPKRG